MEQLNEAIIKVGPFWSILIEPAEGMGFLLRSERAQNCQMTKISARSAAVRLTQFVGLLFGDVSSEWKKDNWLVESSNISGNISCWWHMILHFHPGNFSMEPENTPRKEEENHLNQNIIFRFYVNFPGCISFCWVGNSENKKNKQSSAEFCHQTLSKLHLPCLQSLREQVPKCPFCAEVQYLRLLSCTSWCFLRQEATKSSPWKSTLTIYWNGLDPQRRYCFEVRVY